MKAFVRGTLRSLSELLEAREMPFRGQYATFAEAVAATPRHRRLGYDHAEAAEMYLHEFRNMRSSDYPVIYWLEKNFHAGLRVFDWGGNIGHAYYAYQNYLTDPQQLIWTICDVPQVTRVGVRLALDSEARNLTFTSDPTDCDGYDVLLIAGTLQFLAEPLTALLRTLPRKPRRLILNRTPTHPSLGYFTIQDIGPAVCPYQIFAEPTLVESLAAEGYTLKDRWPCEGKSVRIPTYPRSTVAKYVGFYFERKAKFMS